MMTRTLGTLAQYQSYAPLFIVGTSLTIMRELHTWIHLDIRHASWLTQPRFFIINEINPISCLYLSRITAS